MTESLAVCARCGLSAPLGALGACPRCMLTGLDDDEPLPPNPPGLSLLEEIGRGGMGRVYRARHERLDRLVAVKLLPAELAEDAGFRARFEREARTLARLRHPNIVAVHDFGALPDGSGYLVMEHVSGGTLRARLPLRDAAAEQVLRELCSALAYAHGAGVVHRDIKPENVLFDAEGRACLADFGIARLVADEQATLTAPQLVLGTPRYMAPETRAGSPPDARADIFSLGVMLEEMLGPDASPRLAAIARRAQAQSGERYRSAEELLNDLNGLPLLRADEQSWVRAVALTLTGATAVSLYALLVSITPRVLGPAEQLPFIVFDAQRLPDGGWATRARFEVWPTLAAVAVWVVAFAAYGALRWHWRVARLETPEPERPLELRPLARLAVFMNLLFVVHLLLEQSAFKDAFVYMPVLGGVLELCMVYLAWSAVLEATRRSRSLLREPFLWLWAAISLLPPAVTYVRLIRGG